MKNTYKELFQLFSGYFHQDWEDEFIWEDGEEKHFRAATEAYREDCLKEELEATIKELETLLNQHYTDQTLEDIVAYKLGCAIDPEGFGLDYQQFLIEVLKNLKK